MRLHTNTGLNLQLAGQGQARAFDMGNLVHRRAAALAIQSVDGVSFSNELITGLNQRPGTLTPELREEFDRITSTIPQFPDVLVSSLESLLMREPAANGTVFVAARVSMEEFLRASGIGPNEQLPGISERAVRAWGRYEHQTTKSFREPRTLQVAQAIALHADMVARGEGSRVDPLEFAGHIYPELRVMLEEATQTKNVVYVKPPAFMAHLPFKEHTFQKFASGLANSGLAKRMGKDVGIAIERLQAYVSDKSAKITPYVSTLREISKAIAYDALAAEDGQYAREVFRYLMVLRLRDFLTVEQDGGVASLVPIEENGLPAMRTIRQDVASRYTIIVKPDMRALHGSGEAAKHARRWRWIDRIMSDHYDNRISEWERRHASFDAFEHLSVTHHNGKRVDLHSLRTRLDSFVRRHDAYKARLEQAGGAHDALSHDEVAECSRFYSVLENAFRQSMHFTHVRGKVQRDGRSISYEIVSQPGARSAARIPSGFAPVYGGDVFAQDWSANRQEALISLRAIRGYLARTGQLPNSETRFAEEVMAFYWPGRLVSDFKQALIDLRELGGQDFFLGNGQGQLPLSSKLTWGDGAQPDFFLHDAAYANAVPQPGETKLQAMIRRFYTKANWSMFASGDSWVVQEYLNAVRYPHYVYDQNLLSSLIARANPTGPAHAAARSRIETLFGAHSIKNEVAHNREQAGLGNVNARTITDQAFADYRKFFSPLVSHGLELPVEENLVQQIARGLVARHSTVKASIRSIVKGVFAAIRHYNRSLCSGARRLPENKLLQRGLFDSRFNRFVDAWLARSGRRELPLDRRALISAANSLMSMAIGVEDVVPAVVEAEVKEVADDVATEQIADAVSFMQSWLKRQRRDIDLMTRMLSDATYGVEAFMNRDGQRYRSPLIPVGDYSTLATRAIRRRLSMSGPIDGRTEAMDVLNDRFEFLPQVREQAAIFMQAAVAHYLKWLRSNLGRQLGAMVEALELMDEGEHPVTDHNNFVEDLVEIADASIPLDILHSAYPSLRVVERVHRVSGELSNGIMPSDLTVSDGVASIVRSNKAKAREERAEIDRLMAVVRSKVEIAQSAVERGRREILNGSQQVADLMVSRAVRVAGEIEKLSTRIPKDDQSMRSPSALHRVGHIAHSGAAWVAQELDFNSGTVLRMVDNLQSYVVGTDFTPWRNRLSGIDERLVELGLGFEEAKDAITLEKERREKDEADAKADAKASAAIALAAKEVGRLGMLVAPDAFVERFNRLMSRLDGVESRSDDQKSYAAALSAHAEDRKEARSVARYIDRRLARIVNGIEIDHKPEAIIAQIRLAASQADNLRDSANAAAEDVLRALEKSKKDATALTEMRARIVQALGTARHRLANAERTLPPASDIDMMGINRIVGKVRDVAHRGGAQVTLYMAKKMSKGATTKAKESLKYRVRTLAVLSVGGRGYLVEMDEGNQRKFDAWLDGGRKDKLILAGVGGNDVAIPQGSLPVYTTPISSLPDNHPLSPMAGRFRALIDNNTPARSFVSWVNQQRRNGGDAVSRIWDHIVVRLADPELAVEDVPGAVADVAAAMRHDVRAVDPSLRWVDVVTQYEPVTRPMFADERRQLIHKNSSEIDDNMILRVGGRRAVIHVMTDFVNAVEHSTFMPKHPARLHLWRTLFKSSRGPIVRGIASAAAAWAIIDRAERNGHPYAGTLRRQLLSRLSDVMFPRGIKPKPSSMVVDAYTNDIARTAEEFYIELYTELEHPRLIHDETLGYGVARHQSVGVDILRAMGFHEGSLAHRLVSTIFQHNCYLPSGYALWRAFGNDEGSPELRDAMSVIFMRYGSYTLDESEPLSIHWMLEEMQDVLSTVERARSENRPLPRWWTTPADAVLAGLVPEIVPVSWWRIDHTIRPDSGSDKRAAIHNAAHRFVELFPEFAGAVAIIETVRDAIGTKREYPFIQKIAALYFQVGDHAGAGTLEGVRDAIAAKFRKHYLSKLPFVRAVLTKSLEGRQTLAEDLRIQDAIPREMETTGAASMLGARAAVRGTGVDPHHKPSK